MSMMSFCAVLSPTTCLGWDLGLNWISFYSSMQANRKGGRGNVLQNVLRSWYLSLINLKISNKLTTETKPEKDLRPASISYMMLKRTLPAGNRVWGDKKGKLWKKISTASQFFSITYPCCRPRPCYLPVKYDCLSFNWFIAWPTELVAWNNA